MGLQFYEIACWCAPNSLRDNTRRVQLHFGGCQGGWMCRVEVPNTIYQMFELDFGPRPQTNPPSMPVSLL